MPLVLGFFGVCCVQFGLTGTAAAGTDIWTNTATNNNLSNSPNTGYWSGDTNPVSGDLWNFASSNTSGQTLTNNFTGMSLIGLVFSNTAGSITLTGNSLTLTGGITNNSIVTQTINNNLIVNSSILIYSGQVNNNCNITLGGNLSGTGTIAFGANGSLARSINVTGTNVSFAGYIDVQNNNGMRFRLNNANAGSGSATWNMNNNTTAGTSLGFGNGTISFGALRGGGQFRQDASGTSILRIGDLNTSTSFTGTFNQGNAANILSILKVGTGTLTLSGNNAHTGGVTVQGGTLAITTTIAALGTGTVTVDGTNAGAAILNLGGLTYTNTFTLTTNGGTIANGTISNAATFTRFTNGTVGAVLTGAVGLTKSGTGTLTLTGNNTYSGGTLLNAGTLAISNNAAFGSGTVTIASNATVASLANLTVTNSYIISNGATATFDVAVGTSLSNSTGVISGGGGLTKVNSGTLTLSGSNSYTGGTTVKDGTLAITTTNAALGTGAVTVDATNAGAAILDLGGLTYTNTFALTANGGIIQNGTISNSVTFTSFTNGTVGALLIGAVGLTKVGGGTVILSSSNGYSGGTIVNAGTLAAGANNAFGSGSLTVNGGSTLSLGSNNATVGDVILASGAVLSGTGTLTATKFTVNDQTISAVLAGNGSLTQSGSGTTTLLASNSYRGGTYVTSGTLALGNTYALGNGSLVISNAKLSTVSPNFVNIFDLNGNNMALMGGATLELGNSAQQPSFINVGALTISGSGNIITNTTAPTSGNFALISAAVTNFTGSLGYVVGSQTVSLNGPTVTNATDPNINYKLYGSNNAIYLTVVGATVNLTWTGASNNAWNTNAINWAAGSFSTNFRAGNNVFFANLSTSTNITVTNSGVSAGTMTISGNTGSITFTNGSISASVVTVTNNAGTITFNNASLTNTGLVVFGTNSTVMNSPLSVGSGGVLVNRASLTLASNSIVTNANVAVLNGGTLTVSNALLITNPSAIPNTGGLILGSGTIAGSGTITATFFNLTNGTVSASLAGTGSLTQAGGGTVSLLASNNYAGGTVVNGGVLNVTNGALGTGTVSVINSGSINLGGNLFTNTFALGGGTLQNGTISNNVNFTLLTNGTVSARLAGSASLIQSGSGTLILSGLNSYTGSTTVNSGSTLIVSGLLGGGNYTANIANFASLIFSNSASQILSGVYSGGSSGTLTMLGNGTLTLGTTDQGNLSVGGGIVNIATNVTVASGAFLYVGGGTLSLAGGSSLATSTNSYFGTTLPGGIGGGNGVMILNGSSTFTQTGGTAYLGNDYAGSVLLNGAALFTNSGAISIGESYIGTMTLNNLSRYVGSGSMTIGNNGGASGILTLNDTSTASINGVLTLGNGNGASGSLILNGSSTFTANNNPNSIGYGGSGVLTINGSSVFRNNKDLLLGVTGSGNGGINLNGGSLISGYGQTGWVSVGVGATNSQNTINITGGIFQLASNSSIRLSVGSGNTGVNTINQNGGTVAFYSDAGATTLGGTGNLDLNYSNSTASATDLVNTYNLNGGTLIVSSVTSTKSGGTRTFNFGGGTLTYPGSGRTNNNFLDIGSSGVINVLSGGAFIDSSNNVITISRSLLTGTTDGSLDGGLTKLGSGTLILSGNNGYTGGTFVKNGTLSISNSTALGFGGITVTNANLSTAIRTNSIIDLGGNAMTLLGSATLSIASDGSVPSFTNVGALYITTGSNVITNTNIIQENGIYTLIRVNQATNVYGTNLGYVYGTNTIMLNASPKVVYSRTSYALTNNNGLIQLVVQGGANLTWTGSNNNAWDTNTPNNWIETVSNVTSSAVFNSKDNVTFTGLTSDTNIAVSIAGVQPGFFNISNNSGVITFTGGIITAISGVTVINSTAVISPRLIIRSGGITIDNGSLTVAATTMTNGNLTIVNGGNLTNNDAMTILSGGVVLNGGAISGSGTISAKFFNLTNGSVSNSLIGTGTLIASGGGTVSLYASNAYTGGTIVNGSTIYATNSSGIPGLGTGIVTVSNNGLLDLGGAVFTNTFTLGGGIIRNGTISNSANFTGFSNGTVSAGLDGSVALIKGSEGTLIISGSNSYTGGTLVTNGTLVAGNADAFSIGGVTNKGGIIDLGAGIFTNTFTLGSGTIQNGVISNNSPFLTLTNGTVSAGLIGSGFLQMSGNGTLILNGYNSYSGSTLITSGTLIAGNSNALSTTDIVVSGGVLNLGGNRFANSFTLYGGLITNGTITNNGLYDQLGNGTVAANLVGSGTLVHGSVGTLTLSGANKYTGGNLLTGGTVVAMTTNALGAGGRLTNGGLSITNAELYVAKTNTLLTLGNGIALQGSATVTLAYGSSLTNRGNISITYAPPSSTNIINLDSTWSTQFNLNNVSGTYDLISGKSGGITGASSNTIALNFTVGSTPYTIPFGKTVTNANPNYDQTYTFTSSPRSLRLIVADVWAPIQTLPKWIWYYDPYVSPATRADATNGGVQEISAAPFNSSDLSAVLNGNGQVVVVAPNFYGNNTAVKSVPTAASNGVTRISAGYAHIMALKNGGVISWPALQFDPTPVPDRAKSGVVEISAGYSSCLALRSDGTVVAWGYKYTPQPGIFVYTVDLFRAGTAVATLRNVIGIADGYRNGLALLRDGTVVGFGEAFDVAKYYSADVEVNAQGLTNVAAISLGETFALALKKDGTVVAWGNNDLGQTAVPAGLSGVISISAGADFALALKSDGSVVAWGNPNYTNVPSGLLPVAAIEAGNWYSLVARTNNGLFPLDDCHTAGGLKGGGGGGNHNRILPVPWSTPAPRSTPAASGSSSSTQPVRAPQRVLPSGR